MANKAMDCQFFLQGRCFRGDACTFLHDEAKKPPTGASPSRFLKPCIYFQQGYCARGSSCLFQHTASADSPGICLEHSPGPDEEPETARAPSLELEKFRQAAIKAKMSHPLISGNQPKITPPPAPPPRPTPAASDLFKNPLRNMKKAWQETAPEKAASPAKVIEEPKQSAPEPKRFGKAARDRALAAGKLAATGTTSDTAASKEGESRKRKVEPIVFKPDSSTSKAGPAVGSPVKRAKPAPEPTAASRGPKEPIPVREGANKGKRAPLIFNPQPVKPAATASTPAAVLKPAQPTQQSKPAPIKVAAAAAVPKATVPKANAATPKAPTPRASVNGELQLEDEAAHLEEPEDDGADDDELNADDDGLGDDDLNDDMDDLTNAFD